MNFEWDGKLAERQDRVIDALFVAPYHGNPADERALLANVAVSLLAPFCLCNLTVRHWCILDLINGKPKHINRILWACMKLTYGGLWLEGYSYWCYTRRILELYANRFVATEITQFGKRANIRFIALSYRRGDKMYPPPFGDVWDSPMIEQYGSGCDTIHIKLPAVGFNLHTNFVDKIYDVSSGIPVEAVTRKPFVFYEGYEKKYPTKWSELCAIVSRFFELLRHGLS